METIDFEEPSAFLVGERRIQIVLVGCGGTGSHLAQELAKLMFHLKDTRHPVGMEFIDGDTVERKNCGRQLFVPAEIGLNKAQALAHRFNRGFGLNITALPEMFDKPLHRYYGDETTRLWVGAVDNGNARRTIENSLSTINDIWVDVGNHEWAGQVLVGNATRYRMEGAFSLPGICTALPVPTLQMPDLTRDAVRVAGADCAQLVLDNAQAFYVNSWMARLAAQVVYDLVVRRSLTVFQVYTDLQSFSTRGLPITARNVERETGISYQLLTADSTLLRRAS